MMWSGTELDDLPERDRGAGSSRLVVEHSQVARVRVARYADPHALYLEPGYAPQGENQLRVAGRDEPRTDRFFRYVEGVRRLGARGRSARRDQDDGESGHVRGCWPWPFGRVRPGADDETSLVRGGR